jgi:uncharacterized protein YtpQ (UPF0354 family)
MSLSERKIQLLRNIIRLLILVLCAAFVIWNWGIKDYLRNDNWRERVLRPELTEAEFTQIILDAVIEEDSSIEAIISGPLEITAETDEGEFCLYLGNIWQQCKDNHELRVDICENYLSALINDLRISSSSEVSIEPNEIVPVIKDMLYIEQLRGQFDDVNNIAVELLAGDIYIAYAMDLDDRVMFMNKSELNSLGLTKTELLDLSVKNLRRKIKKIRRYGDGPIYLMSVGGTFEASLLLMDDIWDKQSELVPGELVAGVPCRDVLIFTGSESEEGIEQLYEVVEETYQNEGYLISKTLLVYRNNKWQVFESHEANGFIHSYDVNKP